MEGSVRGIIPTYSVRKPECSEKTHDFWESVDGLFSHKCHKSVARTEPTISEVKGACSDDCATEAPEYIKILPDCDWLISVQLISNISTKICNSAKICNKLDKTSARGFFKDLK